MTRKRLIVILLIAGFSGGIILGLSIPHLWRREIPPRFGPNHFLANYLSLSDSQGKKVGFLNRSLYARVEKLRTQLTQKRDELSKLLEEFPPNREEIEDKLDEIVFLQAQLEREVINHLVEVGKILTPTQRSKFLSFTRRGLRPGRRNWKKIR